MKVSKLKTAAWVVCVLVVVCAAVLVMSVSVSPQGGPTLFYSAVDPKTGMAVVVLTNATTRSWSFTLNAVEGLPTPSYWIAPERKGLPGWGSGFQEGIYCSGYLYRRDSSGRYLSPEVPGPSPKLTRARTNVVLHPQQALTFSVPIGEIYGLSKVGVKYHRLPPSSRLGRAAADLNKWMRRVLGLQPAVPFEGWCETPLPTPRDAL